MRRPVALALYALGVTFTHRTYVDWAERTNAGQMVLDLVSLDHAEFEEVHQRQVWQDDVQRIVPIDQIVTAAGYVAAAAWPLLELGRVAKPVVRRLRRG